MGVTTSFFTATTEALAAAAPGWIAPKYGAFSESALRNPFTGDVRRVKRFVLLNEPPAEAGFIDLAALVPKERLYAWKLPGDELQQLMRLLTDAPDEEIAMLDRAALLGPMDAEEWLFEVPPAFVAALARLSPERRTITVAAWQEKIGWRAPPDALLDELCALARRAHASPSGERMFFYVYL